MTTTELDLMMERLRSNTLWFVMRLIPLGFLFMAVYAGTSLLATGRKAMPLAFDWEHRVPFVSGAFWIYLSILAVFWVPLFVMDRRLIRRLMWRYILVTLAAGTVFLLVPTTVALELPEPQDLPSLYRALYLLGSYNAAPSLHVAYTLLVLGSCARAGSIGVRIGLVVWLILIVLSTWLIHQHQLVDIVSGAVLGWLGGRGIRPEPRPQAA